ncbi:MAG: TraX family protein [Pygmaiobacter sp.]
MSTTTLKLIALGLMFLDHIYEFIGGAPIVLTWLGRMSASLFVFCTAWGFFYTRNRKKYLLNLYVWGVGMAVLDVLLSVLVPSAKTQPINDIFVTLLLSCMIIAIIEGFRGGDRVLAKQLLVLLLVAQVASDVLGWQAQMRCEALPLWVLPVAIFPSVLLCEGGLLWVTLGVCLYFTRTDKKKLTLVYVLFSFLWLLLVPTSFTCESLLMQNYQWMMIGALPLMLCYNGKKGRGLKWLFYVFYPAHIALLCVLGSVVSF